MTVGGSSSALTRAERDLVETLSARWTIHILLILRTSEDMWRFGEIQEAVSGISNRVLSGRLAGLENSGLVSRNVDATRPVTITYRLTAQGRRVAGVLTCLREAAESRLDR
ncbi:helix-turn-helix domain-containing protein [Embleya sp. NPDC005575]|uniref:winged helix-turn-helix transcriptional regulator n=1 Tax=Embleya sp. NPDC005575 TaxID=3156892 RepID=UPI0033A5D508